MYGTTDTVYKKRGTTTKTMTTTSTLYVDYKTTWTFNIIDFDVFSYMLHHCLIILSFALIFLLPFSLTYVRALEIRQFATFFCPCESASILISYSYWFKCAHICSVSSVQCAAFIRMAKRQFSTAYSLSWQINDIMCAQNDHQVGRRHLWRRHYVGMYADESHENPARRWWRCREMSLLFSLIRSRTKQLNLDNKTNLTANVTKSEIHKTRFRDLYTRV